MSDSSTTASGDKRPADGADAPDAKRPRPDASAAGPAGPGGFVFSTAPRVFDPKCVPARTPPVWTGAQLAAMEKIKAFDAERKAEQEKVDSAADRIKLIEAELEVAKARIALLNVQRKVAGAEATQTKIYVPCSSDVYTLSTSYARDVWAAAAARAGGDDVLLKNGYKAPAQFPLDESDVQYLPDREIGNEVVYARRMIEGAKTVHCVHADHPRFDVYAAFDDAEAAAACAALARTEVAAAALPRGDELKLSITTMPLARLRDPAGEWYAQGDATSARKFVERIKEKFATN